MQDLVTENQPEYPPYIVLYNPGGQICSPPAFCRSPWCSQPLALSGKTSLDVKGNGHASSDLSLRRFTSVTSVDLNSLTYADGATWQASSPGACSVVPDPLMLVSAARSSHVIYCKLLCTPKTNGGEQIGLGVGNVARAVPTPRSVRRALTRLTMNNKSPLTFGYS